MAGLSISSVRPIRSRIENKTVHILPCSPMCEIEGVDITGSTLTRAAFFPSILVPSRLGPLSAAPSTLTSECRCGLLWLASPPSILTSLPFLLSSLTDLPSRLRLPPGSPAFSFLNGFEKDFRISMRELYRCRSWRVTEIVVAVQLSSARGAQQSHSPVSHYESDNIPSHPLLVLIHRRAPVDD